jgi:hypothetical protein
LQTDLNDPKDIEFIPISRISAYHGLMPDGRSAETWRVSLRGVSKPAYLKLTDSAHQIIADLAAAQIGRALRLPIPRPHFVVLKREDLPQNSQHKGTGVMFAFASEDAGEHAVSFSALAHSSDPTHRESIKKWPGRIAAIAFDEWIANADRHFGNLLYNPADQSYWLIDHGDALAGSYWLLWGGLPAPTHEINNALLDASRTDLNTPRKKELMRDAVNQRMCAWRRIDLSGLDKDGHFARIEATRNSDAIRDFIQKRAFHTASLICKQIGIQELPLAG